MVARLVAIVQIGAGFTAGVSSALMRAPQKRRERSTETWQLFWDDGGDPGNRNENLPAMRRTVFA